MKCHVIVEGQTDLALMKRVLAAYGDQINYILAGGASTVSIARMILASDKQPIVLVMDADVSAADIANERREEVEAALRQFGSSRRFHVVSFVPEIEVVLLEDEYSRAAITGNEPLSIEERILAKYEPKKVIEARAKKQGVSLQSLVQTAIAQMNPAAVLGQESFEGLEAFLQRWTSAAA